MRKALRFPTAVLFLITGITFFGGNAFGQNDSSSPAQNPDQSAASPAPAEQTAPKKVWTNDDGRFHSRPSPSTDTTTKAAGAANKPKPNNNGKTAGYRAQITKLQGQIPPLDDKIAQLQAALNGQTTNAPRTYGWSKPDDWHDALARYQKQREDIQAKISALEDEARHSGVPESEIP